MHEAVQQPGQGKKWGSSDTDGPGGASRVQLRLCALLVLSSLVAKGGGGTWWCGLVFV